MKLRLMKLETVGKPDLYYIQEEVIESKIFFNKRYWKTLTERTMVTLVHIPRYFSTLYTAEEFANKYKKLNGYKKSTKIKDV